jgi:photosystem II stability/assembly factor-like uncharacterized protein
MHTTDGGLHWTDVTPKGVGPNFDDYYLDAVHAWVNDWTGTGPYQLTTYRTADGGRTWQRGTALTFDAVGLADYQFYFLDPDHGWLLVSTRQTTNGVYADTVYRTVDGGLHWTIGAVHAAPPGWTSPTKFYCYEWCNQMAFISPMTGWLSIYQLTPPVGHALLVTHDGGITWKQQALPRTNVTCPCFANSFVVFDDLRAMFLVSGPYSGAVSSAVALTYDGGQSWVVRSLPGETQAVVGFYDLANGWAIAGSRANMDYPQPPASITSPTLPLPLYRTADGGATWKLVPTDLQLQSAAGRIGSLYFVDDEVGFAVRQTPTNGSSQLLKTIDGGRTWNLIASNL